LVHVSELVGSVCVDVFTRSGCFTAVLFAIYSMDCIVVFVIILW